MPRHMHGHVTFKFRFQLNSDTKQKSGIVYLPRKVRQDTVAQISPAINSFIKVSVANSNTASYVIGSCRVCVEFARGGCAWPADAHALDNNRIFIIRKVVKLDALHCPFCC